MRCGASRPPVPEQRLINRLHAEKMKRRKDAAEAKVERKRKRKARHDKACKLARAEGKAQPATPESSEEDEEEASDAEDHVPRGDGEGASPPPFYLWDEEEEATVAPEEPRAAGGSLANLSLEGVARESSLPAAGEESPAPQVLIHGHEAAAERSRPHWQPRGTGLTRGGRLRGSLRGTARCPRLERASRGSGA